MDASKITNGRIDPHRMGSGTPGKDKFLRGDGVWAEPPAGEPGQPGQDGISREDVQGMIDESISAYNRENSIFRVEHDRLEPVVDVVSRLQEQFVKLAIKVKKLRAKQGGAG